MSSMESEASFSAQLESLYPMLEWTRTHLKLMKLSDVEIRRIELALEEGLVNVISYAYEGKKGEIILSIYCEEGKYFEIKIRDNGCAFNPLEHPKNFDPCAPIEEREEGGLGILFIEKLMDEVKYERSKEQNILTLRKNLD